MVGPIRALLFVPVLLIAACGGGTDEAPKGVGDHVFSAQQKALEIILAEGIENVWKRVSNLGAATRAAVKAMGLETFSRAPADCLTTVKIPDGVDGLEVVKDMREVQGVTPAGGQAQLKGKIVRLASMGYVNHFDIIVGLTALANAIRKQGGSADLGAGIDAFVNELD